MRKTLFRRPAKTPEKAEGNARPFLTKRKKLLLAAVAIAVTGATITSSVLAFRPASTAASGNTVVEPESTEIVKQDLATSVSVMGTLTSMRSWTLTSRLTDTEVTAVHVKVGDRVHAGDILVELDDTDAKLTLQNSQNSLSVMAQQNTMNIESADRALKDAQTAAQVGTERANNAAKDAQSKLDQANSQNNHASEEPNNARSALSEREKAAQQAQAEFDSAKTAAENAAHSYSSAQAALNAANELVKEKKAALDAAAPEQKEQAQKDYDQAVNNQRTAQSAQDSAKTAKDAADLALTEAQTVLTNAQTALADAKSAVQDKEANAKTAADAVESSKDALEQAKQAQQDQQRNGAKSVADAAGALDQAKISQSTSLQSARMDVKKNEVLVADAVIKAPSDGIITEIAVQAGDIYKGDTILVIQDDSGYKVAAKIDQYDIGGIATGQNAQVELQSGGDKEFGGKVTFVSPIPAEAAASAGAAPGSSTTPQYPIEVTIEQPDESLRIGMNTKLTVYTQQAKDALTVPSEFVQTDENGEPYVIAITDSGSEEKIPVQYGMMTDYYVQIQGKGLCEGMKVLAAPMSSSGTDADASLLD